MGTGPGILVPLLCERAKFVVSFEADAGLHSDAAATFSGLSNLKLVHGDGFDSDEQFSIFVSNLPYSESRNALEWLARKKFTRAVIMVQKEFADKLLSMEDKAMRAVSVIANHAFDIERLMSVGRNNFAPPPSVDSVILRLEQKNVLSADLIRSVNGLFSYRRKTVGNIAKKFGKEIQSDKRLEELSGDEIIDLAKKVI